MDKLKYKYKDDPEVLQLADFTTRNHTLVQDFQKSIKPLLKSYTILKSNANDKKF